MYVYTCTCVTICVHTCRHTGTNAYVDKYTCKHACALTCIDTCTYACTYAGACTCTCPCVCMCMYILLLVATSDAQFPLQLFLVFTSEFFAIFIFYPSKKSMQHVCREIVSDICINSTSCVFLTSANHVTTHQTQHIIQPVTWNGCRIKILEARSPHVRRGDQSSAEALGDSYLIL